MKPTDMRQPKALFVLFFTEMWERFSYYGMRALLILYLIQQLFNFEGSKSVAIGIFAAYGSLVYASPFFGGLIADKFLGHRKAVIWGAIMMAAGHFFMAIENETFLYIALSFLIIGNGFFKPNMPIILSSLYKPNDPRRDGGFTIYYMSVNLGAFLSPVICGFVGETYGWSYGFAIAGIGMLAGLFIFLKFYGVIESHISENSNQTDNKSQLSKQFIGIKTEYWIYILCLVCVFGISLLVKNYEITTYILIPFTIAILGFIFIIALRSPKIERDRLFVILILLAFITLFWSFFEQAGSSLTLYAEENVNRDFLGKEIPTSIFQSINPMFILIFATPLSILWMNLAQRKKEPTTPIKFSLGILLLSLGFLILGLAPYFLSFKTIAENGLLLKIATVPAIFLVLSYLLQTLGELCLSPIGLSMVSRLAPAKIAGMVIGAWYLSSSLAFQIGGWIANISTSDITKDESTFFWNQLPENDTLRAYCVTNKDFADIIQNSLFENAKKNTPKDIAINRGLELINSKSDSSLYYRALEVTYENIQKKEAENTELYLRNAVEKDYISETEIAAMNKEETVSFVNLLRYTKVFTQVGFIALIASILLFILSPFIQRMMHED